MARVGANPRKKSGEPARARAVTLATIVHIPELSGYWAESLDVLRVCLASARTTAGPDADLMVFDNASCRHVREHLSSLYEREEIDYLFFSRRNVGKNGAWNILLPAAPGEFVAYFDSDVLFLPGWLEKSLAVFKTFGRVGAVTARPVRLARPIEDDLDAPAMAYAAGGDPELTVERGDLIPIEVIREHFRSAGVTDERAGFPACDVKLTKGGVSAFVQARHFQFVTSKAVIRDALPLDDHHRPLGGARAWDLALTRLGYMRLSTDQPLVRHLGNSLRNEDLGEWAGFIDPSASSVIADRQRRPWYRRLAKGA
jgi:hypothetical protein